MNPALEIKIRATVTDLVTRGIMFTAWDITKIVRNDGEFARHGEVNQIVKAMAQNGEMDNYINETVTLAGVAVAPLVYYHQFSDVTNYNKDWVENDSTQTATASQPIQNLSSNSVSPTQNVSTPLPPVVSPVLCPIVQNPQTTVSSGLLNVTATRSWQSAPRIFRKQSDGRLNIPPLLATRIALPGESVCVFKEMDMSAPAGKQHRVVIRKNDSSNSAATTCKINSDGRIRLSPDCLTLVNGGDLQIQLFYGVPSVTEDSIVVTAV